MAENHEFHVCVDELVSSIIQGAKRIEKMWEERELSCYVVREAGLVALDEAVWDLVSSLEDLEG